MMKVNHQVEIFNLQSIPTRIEDNYDTQFNEWPYFTIVTKFACKIRGSHLHTTNYFFNNTRNNQLFIFNLLLFCNCKKELN